MKEIAFVLAFATLVVLFLIDSIKTEDRFESWVLRVAERYETHDQRMFKINNRLLTLEEQRDIETRVTNLEKALRVFCTGTKTEMCGTLKVVD